MTFNEWWEDCMGWTEYEPDIKEKALAEASWNAAMKQAKASIDIWKANYNRVSEDSAELEQERDELKAQLQLNTLNLDELRAQAVEAAIEYADDQADDYREWLGLVKQYANQLRNKQEEE